MDGQASLALALPGCNLSHVSMKYVVFSTALQFRVLSHRRLPRSSMLEFTFEKGLLIFPGNLGIM